MLEPGVQPISQPDGQPKRPVQVTAAAGIAVVSAIFMAFSSMLSLGVLALFGPLAGSANSALFVLVGLVGFPVAGCLIWGAIQAVRGESGRVLIMSSLAALALRVFGLTFLGNAAHGAYFWAILGLILQGAIIVFLRQTPSTEYFQAKQARVIGGTYVQPPNQPAAASWPSESPYPPATYGAVTADHTRPPYPTGAYGQ